MTAEPKPTTHSVRRLAVDLAVWECDVCEARRPDAGRSTRQFVNATGVCPRCAARELSAAEVQP